MSTKRTMTILAAAAAVLLAGWGDAAVRADAGPADSPQAQWEHMQEMRAIMHFAQFSAEPREDGVRVTVTATDPALVAAIQDEFAGERHDPGAYIPETEVATEVLENGAALTYTSDDPQVVRRLQAYGTGLAYARVRDGMHALMHGSARGRGYGRMHGWDRDDGPGWGHGPGMMGPGHGPGYGRGYGPGYGPGPGMMGPGAGYGPGAGPGNGPAQGYGKRSAPRPGWGYGPGAPSGTEAGQSQDGGQ